MGEQALGRAIRSSQGLATPFGPETSPFEVDLEMFRAFITPPKPRKKKQAPSISTLGTPFQLPFNQSSANIPFSISQQFGQAGFSGF